MSMPNNNDNIRILVNLQPERNPKFQFSKPTNLQPRPRPPSSLAFHRAEVPHHSLLFSIHSGRQSFSYPVQCCLVVSPTQRTPHSSPTSFQPKHTPPKLSHQPSFRSSRGALLPISLNCRVDQLMGLSFYHLRCSYLSSPKLLVNHPQSLVLSPRAFLPNSPNGCVDQLAGCPFCYPWHLRPNSSSYHVHPPYN